MNITSASPFAAHDAQPLIEDSDICNFQAAVLPSKLTIEIYHDLSRSGSVRHMSSLTVVGKYCKRS